MKFVLVIIVGMIGLNVSGCYMQGILDPDVRKSRRIDSAISEHADVSHMVKIGDRREKVLAILLPTQKGLPPDTRKHHESVKKNGILIEVYYMRTGRNPDGRTTDDEFTPYVFFDGKLVAIGWKAGSLLED